MIANKQNNNAPSAQDAACRRACFYGRYLSSRSIIISMRITLCWLFFSWCSFAAAADWGELPDGFTWHENSEAKVAIPLPKGWYVKEEVRDGTVGLFLSEEDIAKQGKFDTGYTLNYVTDISDKTGMDVTQYAA